MLSESGIAGDLYHMIHVLMGELRGVGYRHDFADGSHFRDEWFERGRDGHRVQHCPA